MGPSPLTENVAHHQQDRLWFWCPGCDDWHAPQVDGSRGWVWNGSLEAPTISPSVLVTSYCGEVKGICHSFVENGQIRFLADCTHEMRGTIQPLPVAPEL